MPLRQTDIERLEHDHPLGIPPAGLQAPIVERTIVRSVRNGGFLLRSGESGKETFALREGRTRHPRSAADADEVMRPGRCRSAAGSTSAAASAARSARVRTPRAASPT